MDLIEKALQCGYESEMNAEEQIEELYNSGNIGVNWFEGYRKGIRDALRIHGIIYDWMNDAE